MLQNIGTVVYIPFNSVHPIALQRIPVVHKHSMYGSGNRGLNAMLQTSRGACVAGTRKLEMQIYRQGDGGSNLCGTLSIYWGEGLGSGCQKTVNLLGRRTCQWLPEDCRWYKK
jgi:hypothetical protein